MRPKASKPFVANDDLFLEFALTCRSSGITASDYLGLTGIEAFNINHAVMARLTFLDIERAEQERKMLAYEIARATWGNGDNQADYGEAFAMVS